MVLGYFGGMGSDVRFGRMVEGSVRGGLGRDCKGTAVMRGRAGNARLGSV